MVEHSVILDDKSTIELNIDSNIYDLDFIESITPGPPSSNKDYNTLINKPQINSVTLQNNISLRQLGLRSILYGTTEEWNSKKGLITEEGTIYIYSDYSTTTIGDEEKVIPGIKIGDGKAYLIDTPFITQNLQDVLFSHINDLDKHTNLTEKNFWNQKITSYMDNKDPENLIFSNI